MTIGIESMYAVAMPGDRVRDTGARRDQRDPDLARGASVTVGCVHRRLFVAHQHVLDGALLVQAS
jgi:hypothetical protein